MALTAKKRQLLHNAILCYMKDQGFEDSATAFEEESGAKPTTSIPKLLETKWLTVLRQQKKILKLEEELQVLKSDLENAVPYQKRDLDQSLLLPSKTLQEWQSHRQPVTCVRFHPKFTWVVSSSDDCTINLYDWESGKYMRSMRGHTSAVQDLDFDPEGDRLASCSSDMSIKIWDMTDDSFRCVRTLQGHDHNVCGVRFFADMLISCSRDATIKMWDMNSGFCRKTLHAHDEWVKCISVSACGSLIASGSMDKSVRVWSQASGSWDCSQIYNDHDHNVECVEFSNYLADKVLTNAEESKEDAYKEEEGPPQPRFLASGSRDRTILIYDLEEVKCIMVLKGHDNWVRSLQWHPAGKYLVTCADDKSIRVWDLARRREKSSARLEKAHKMFVQTLHYSLISAVVVTGGADNVVKVWECE